MKFWIALASFLLASIPFSANADSVYVPNIPAYVTGTSIGGGHVGLDINGSITATNPSVSATGSAVPSDGTYIGGNKSGNLTGLLIGQQTSANSLACVLASDQSALAVTGTFWQATQPISAASLPLPTGAATSANQTNGSQETEIVEGGNTAAVTASSALRVDGSAVTQPVSGTFWQATQPISASSLPLPTGAATAANQTNVQSSPGSSASTAVTIQGSSSGVGVPVTGTFWQTTQPVSGTVSTNAPVNANSSLSARQSVNGTESNVQAPTHAVGVILECESGNSDNLRWGFSNSSSAILSTTLGMLCEPGRDSGYLPLSAGNYLHMIAVTTATSDYVDVQWVLSQ